MCIYSNQVHALRGDLLEAIESFHKALGIRRDDTFSTTMLNFVVERMIGDDPPYSGTFKFYLYRTDMQERVKAKLRESCLLLSWGKFTQPSVCHLFHDCIICLVYAPKYLHSMTE